MRLQLQRMQPPSHRRKTKKANCNNPIPHPYPVDHKPRSQVIVYTSGHKPYGRPRKNKTTKSFCEVEKEQ